MSQQPGPSRKEGGVAPETPGRHEPAGERWELLHRVAASTVFQKSNRLRELLLFVGERALVAPDASMREQDIGVEVFGRAVGYDTSQDTLVRVQASQLRKKLQQYFAEDGKEEPMLIDLPKGGYIPVFKPRETLAAPEPAPPAPAAPPRRAWLPWAAALLLALLCGILLFQNAKLRSRTEFGMGPAPTTIRFWQRVLGNGMHNYLVLSDANLVVFEDAIGRHVTIHEYQNKIFESLATSRIQDPAMRMLMLNLVGRVYTGQSDASVARKLSLICAASELRLDVVNAREMSASQIAAHNTILLGSRRANPWLNLFEEKLNYRSGFEESPRLAYFTNQAPKPGEEREYRGHFGRLGYCRVAFLPNTKGSGNVMLITGTDVASTDAGGEFVTSETWLGVLRRALNLREDEPFPHFEALLRGQVVNNSVPQFQFVTARRH